MMPENFELDGEVPAVALGGRLTKRTGEASYGRNALLYVGVALRLAGLACARA